MATEQPDDGSKVSRFIADADDFYEGSRYGPLDLLSAACRAYWLHAVKTGDLSYQEGQWRLH